MQRDLYPGKQEKAIHQPLHPAPPSARPPRMARRQQAPGRVFRRTTYRRAFIEGLILYACYVGITALPVTLWPASWIGVVLLLLLLLRFAPPVWATLRIRSTRRERLSRRFLILGPLLALACTLLDTLGLLFLGNRAAIMGITAPLIKRLMQSGPTHLSVGAFLLGIGQTLGILLVLYTIAVVCTRLAQGGFLRFTMPAGKGRVTL
jgi:hypothetical protein